MIQTMFDEPSRVEPMSSDLTALTTTYVNRYVSFELTREECLSVNFVELAKRKRMP